MEDADIIALFRMRDERAIAEADKKYGRGCRKIAHELLSSPEDAEEAVNEMWLCVWNAIPPAVPVNLFAFLSAAVRNCALNRIEAANTRKRGGGELPLALEELHDCAGGSDSVEATLDFRLLRESIERFLDGLSCDARTIFVERYTNLTPVAEIAAHFAVSESKVKVSLMRTRRKLRTYLKKEGFL